MVLHELESVADVAGPNQVDNSAPDTATTNTFRFRRGLPGALVFALFGFVLASCYREPIANALSPEGPPVMVDSTSNILRILKTCSLVGVGEAGSVIPVAADGMLGSCVIDGQCKFVNAGDIRPTDFSNGLPYPSSSQVNGVELTVVPGGGYRNGLGGNSVHCGESDYLIFVGKGEGGDDTVTVYLN